MLRLSQQVGRHLLRLGALVSDHENFAGTSQRIDAHLAVDRLLGEGDVDVARAADHIHLGNAFSAESHRSNGLSATDAHHRVNAGQMRGCEHDGIHLTIGPGGGADHNLFNAGHTGRDRVHENGAGVGSASTGHVEPRPLHRPPAASQLLAVGPFHADVLRTLALVKFADAAMGQFEGVPQVVRQVLPGLFKLLLRHRNRIGTESVEALGELAQGSITALTNRREDGLNPVLHLFLLAALGATGQPLQLSLSLLNIPDAAQGKGQGSALGQGEGW